jgi:hypothetical protein
MIFARKKDRKKGKGGKVGEFLAIQTWFNSSKGKVFKAFCRRANGRGYTPLSAGRSRLILGTR